MASRKLVGALLSAVLGTVGCVSARAGGTASEQVWVAAPPDTLPIAEVLAQAGYLAAPMRRDGGYRFLQSRIAATPISLLLDSGAPFDLRLDPALDFRGGSGVHATDVLSGYWTSTTSEGRWAIVDQLAIGSVALQALEAKVEPSSVVSKQNILGATALIGQGAIVDYATDTLYLPAPHTPSVARPGTADKPPTLGDALETAGQYRTFLALMQQAGLMPLLSGSTRPAGAGARDSIAWLGLRIRAPQLSGVGAMPPNDVHLQLTRAALDRRLRRPGRHTAFVPTDEAFARLPVDTLRALRADTARLARLLRAHLFPDVAIDTAAMRTLIRGAARPGLEQGAFGFHPRDVGVDVDRLASWEEGQVVARASIVQPDLRAGNGIAHGIDRVLGAFAASSPLAAALVQQGYIAVPLYRHEDGNGYYVRAMVNDIAAQLTLDTGAPLELALDQEWASRLQSAQGRLAVRLGSVELSLVDVTTATFGDSAKFVRSLGYRTGVGAVGSLLLTKYRAYVDYGAGMLYLQVPSVASPVPTSP